MSKSKRDKKWKISNKLTPAQIAQYKRIGVPDMSQDWLELFTNEQVNDLFTIMRSCSDNQRKAEYIERELGKLGFQVVGEGTNILVLSNPVYPGVVFKIALDDNGIADNFNDTILQDIVPRYVKVLARHPSSIVTVQQRGVKPTEEQMTRFRPRILSLLKELSKYFLVADLSPDMFLNYVVDRDGEFLICDGSDLYPLQQIKEPIRCKSIVGEHRKTGEFKYCEGKLSYSEDFKCLICEKCGKSYNPLELRPKKEVEKLYKVMRDGLSVEEQRMLESDELDAIKKRQGIVDEEPSEPVDQEDEGPVVTDLSAMLGVDGYVTETEEPQLPGRIFVADDDQEDPDEGMDEPVSEEPFDPNPDPDEDDDFGHVVFAYPKSPVESGSEDSKTDSTTDEDGESEEGDSDNSAVVIEDHISKVVVIEHHQETYDSSNAQYSDPVSDMANLKRRDIFEFSRKVNEIMVMAGISTDTAKDDKRPIDVVIEQLKEGSIFGDDLDELYAVAKTVRHQSVITNNAPNNNIPSQGVDDSPRLKYQIVEEDGNDSTMSGIYVTIFGDFELAYDEYGLPIYISMDDGETVTRAVSASEIKALMLPAIKLELAMNAESKSDNQLDE